MNLGYLLGFGYFAALVLAALSTAAVRPGWLYVLSCTAFLMLLYIGAMWSVEGEDGPSGFMVIALHGLVFWMFVVAQAVKWIRIVVRRLRSKS
jgi:uncharacterized membrane protein YhaH (DUF805 family)